MRRCITAWKTHTSYFRWYSHRKLCGASRSRPCSRLCGELCSLLFDRGDKGLLHAKYTMDDRANARPNPRDSRKESAQRQNFEISTSAPCGRFGAQSKIQNSHDMKRMALSKLTACLMYNKILRSLKRISSPACLDPQAHSTGAAFSGTGPAQAPAVALTYLRH